MSAAPSPDQLRGFPIEIHPGARPPRLERHQVAMAMRQRYPNRLWMYRGQQCWLEIETGKIGPLSNRRYRAYAPEAVEYVEMMGRGPERREVRSAVPVRVLDECYHHDDLFGPELKAIRTCPWVADDGRLVVAPGYDEDTGIWLHWDGPAADPGAVTDEQVVDVLERLTDFQFRGEPDRVGLLAQLVRIVRNPDGWDTPLGLISAEEPECAKSLLSKLLGLILLGRLPSPTPLRSGTELAYTLHALVQDQPDMLWFDNVGTGSTVGGADLHLLLTASGEVRTRVVGTGEIAGGDPTRIFMLATGNQLDIDAEQARRTVAMRLRARPKGRQFRTPHLLEWVQSNRWLVVSCLLRIVVRWHEAGCPAPPRVLPSFERWSQLVGGPVCTDSTAQHWLSAESRPVPDLDRQLVELYAAWPKQKDGRAKPLKPSYALSIVDRMELSTLAELAGPGSERSRQVKFGKLLTQLSRQDRPVLGWRLRRSDADGAVYAPVPPKGGDLGGGGPDLGGRDPGPKVSVHGPPSQSPGSPGSDRRGVSHGGGGPGGSAPPSNRSGRSRTLGDTASEADNGARISPTEIPPEVKIPPADPACAAVVRMYERGLRVDPEEWIARCEQAERELATSNSDEDRDRLKNLRAYSRKVYAQALTGRVRCTWELQGPGRIGTVEPSLQQITKAYGIRSAIVPDPGSVFVHGDWMAAHLWIAAGLSKDQRLLADLVGGDFYARAGKVWSPELKEPAAAKVCALATINGAAAGKLSEVLTTFGVTLERADAERRRKAWLTRYPALGAFLSAVPRRWVTPLGREVEVPDDRPDHTAAGWLWQSYEADALRIVLRQIPRAVVFTVHDEVLLEVLERHGNRAAQRLRAEMDAALIEVAGLPRNEGITTARVGVRRAWREDG